MSIPFEFLTWSKETRTLVVEDSTLRGNFGEYHEQAFDDACDLGIIVNGRQHSIMFVHDNDVRFEGDLAARVYRPIRSARINRGVPAAFFDSIRDIQLHVLND